jgi:hypothetical protein
MLTIIFLAIIVALLAVGGVFALMAKDRNRKGQSGVAGSQNQAPTQGRASGLD